MTNIPLKLRLTIDPNEADILRNALIDYARDAKTSKENADAAWLMLTVLSKKLIGR